MALLRFGKAQSGGLSTIREPSLLIICTTISEVLINNFNKNSPLPVARGNFYTIFVMYFIGYIHSILNFTIT